MDRMRTLFPRYRMVLVKIWDIYRPSDRAYLWQKISINSTITQVTDTKYIRDVCIFWYRWSYGNLVSARLSGTRSCHVHLARRCVYLRDPSYPKINSMNTQKVYIITWPNGSGKGTVAEYLREKYGAVVYRFSDPLHQILRELWLPNTRENLAQLSLSLRQKFGEDIMGRWVREFIEQNTGKLIILEWIRRVESMREIESMIDHVIWIDAEPSIRYERVIGRWEKHGESTLSREEFDSQEDLETEQTLRVLWERADILIENNWTRDQLFLQIETMIEL
jgi:dephospho-CoA kinase